ncbi:hypothetical protein ACL9RF_01155 [Sphingobacterium sp. Mn56C]|uniref:hypothetical protein n=1 Tax=Sphingobacterium sp. Mn56C TaxID=3395261 RepID=UPI003BDD7743
MMKTNLKNITKLTFIGLTLALTTVSCDKSKDNPGLNLQQEKAEVIAITSKVLTGNYGNPANGPSAFGSRYFNVATGANDSIGSGTFHLKFTGSNNGTVASNASNYTVKFYNIPKGKSFDDLTINADYNSATDIGTSGIGRNTTTTAANPERNANGWWYYDVSSHQAQAVSNVVLFVNTGSVIYALQPTAVVGEGKATSNRAKYTFAIGVLNNN